LGRAPRTPGWIRLLKVRWQDDRVLLIYSVLYPTDKIQWTRHDRQLRPRLQCCGGEAKVPHHCFRQVPTSSSSWDWGHWSQTLLWPSKVTAVVPTTLAKCADNRAVRLSLTEFISEEVSVIQKIWEPESQGLDCGPFSHQIVIGQSIQFFPPALFTGYWTWALSPYICMTEEVILHLVECQDQ
jgi:hypothetical protein